MAELMGFADVDALTALAATASGESEVCFVPALAGLGAPHWKDRARAALTGASLAATRADVARATLEAIAHQIGDVFRAMERDLGATLAMLSVDGGATRNDLLIQWQADLLGRPVQRVKVLELSAFGAGALAGLASGFFDEATIAVHLSEAVDVIAPRLDESARIAKARVWVAAVHSVVDSTVAR
jgi:glycerol kinase